MSASRRKASKSAKCRRTFLKRLRFQQLEARSLLNGVSLIRSPDGRFVSLDIGGFVTQFDGLYGATPLDWRVPGASPDVSILDPRPLAGAGLHWQTGQDVHQASANGQTPHQVARLDDQQALATVGYYLRETSFQDASNGLQSDVYQISGLAPFGWTSATARDDAIAPNPAATDHGWRTSYHPGNLNPADFAGSAMPGQGAPVYFEGAVQQSVGALFIGNEIIQGNEPLPWNQRLLEIKEGRFASKVRISLADAAPGSTAGIVFRNSVPADPNANLANALGAAGYRLQVDRAGLVQILRSDGSGSAPVVVFSAPVLAAATQVNTSAGTLLELRTDNADPSTMELWVEGQLQTTYTDPAPILGPHFGLYARATSGRIKFADRQVFDAGVEFTATYTGHPDGYLQTDYVFANAAGAMPRTFYSADMPSARLNPDLAASAVRRAFDRAGGEIDLSAGFPGLPQGVVPILSSPNSAYALWIGAADESAGLFTIPLWADLTVGGMTQMADGPHATLAAPELSLNPLPFDANGGTIDLESLRLSALWSPVIRHIEPLQISISNTTVLEGDSGTTPAEFVVSLDGEPTQIVTVAFSTAPGTATQGVDYQPTSGTLTFQPGENRKTITVAVQGDVGFDSRTETFRVNLSQPRNAQIAQGSGEGTILETNIGEVFPILSISDATVEEPSTGAANVVFAVLLSHATSQIVTVQFAAPGFGLDTATPGADYLSTSGNLTFAPGQTFGFVTVQVLSDLIQEDLETFTVSLSNVMGAVIGDGDGQGLIRPQGTEPPPPPDVTPPHAVLLPVPQVEEGGETLTVTISYSDTSRVKVQDLDNSDIRVVGPGYNQLATLVGIDPDEDDFAVTAEYRINARFDRWDSTDNGIYTVWIEADQVGDSSIRRNKIPKKYLDSFTVQLPAASAPPEAMLSVTDIGSAGGVSHSFNVTYSDDVGVSVGDFDDDDLLVTWPNGLSRPATLISNHAGEADGSPRMARYSVAAPGGVWDAADIGTYTIAMRSNQVGDTETPQRHVAARDLGQFVVAINSDAPSITNLKTRNAQINQTAAISFEVSDLETPDYLLQVTATSSNTGLVKDGMISFTSNGRQRVATIRPEPNQTGTANIKLKVRDSSNRESEKSFTFTVVPEFVVVAPDAGSRPANATTWPVVRVYEGDTGAVRFEINPYPNFTGGVRVATGDVNGDGVPDIITAPGRGGGPQVKVFDGVSGQRLPPPVGSFFAFENNFKKGIQVAAGDINGDGRAEIIVGTDGERTGTSSRVRIFDGKTGAQQAHFDLGSTSGFQTGVSVAVADVTGDNLADLILGSGPGLAPRVAIANPASGVQIANFLVNSAAFTGGVHLATGDLDGDGIAEIITSAGRGGGPQVKVFSGRLANRGVRVAQIIAYDPKFKGGVRVGAMDYDLDGRADVVTGAGPGGGSHVRVFSADSSRLFQTFAYKSAGVDFYGGLFVAGSPHVDGSSAALRLADRTSQDSGPTIAADELESIRAAAVARWENAGLASGAIAQLDAVRFAVADLPDNLLGLARGGVVLVDRDAAGTGWFIDPTPKDDWEFSLSSAGVLSRAESGVDLLTVVLHEIGHLLGLDHHELHADFDDLMSPDLSMGVRRLPTPELIDRLFARW